MDLIVELLESGRCYTTLTSSESADKDGALQSLHMSSHPQKQSWCPHPTYILSPWPPRPHCLKLGFQVCILVLARGALPARGASPTTGYHPQMDD